MQDKNESESCLEIIDPKTKLIEYNITLVNQTFDWISSFNSKTYGNLLGFLILFSYVINIISAIINNGTFLILNTVTHKVVTTMNADPFILW